MQFAKSLVLRLLGLWVFAELALIFYPGVNTPTLKFIQPLAIPWVAKALQAADLRFDPSLIFGAAWGLLFAALGFSGWAWNMVMGGGTAESRRERRKVRNLSAGILAFYPEKRASEGHGVRVALFALIGIGFFGKGALKAFTSIPHGEIYLYMGSALIPGLFLFYLWGRSTGTVRYHFRKHKLTSGRRSVNLDEVEALGLHGSTPMRYVGSVQAVAATAAATSIVQETRARQVVFHLKGGRTKNFPMPSREEAQRLIDWLRKNADQYAEMEVRRDALVAQLREIGANRGQAKKAFLDQGLLITVPESFYKQFPE